ncbi:recombinase family protein [Patescibacteria group bacterium]|nr:recombinase family protein [Patescibacteria group bacterium]
MKTKYFLYARKSTEDEERQVMSIEAQLAELAEYAKRENIEITETYIESKSAKKPDREVFNKMIKKINGENEPIGIIAWHPDRLARNSVDGGQIIYLIDINKIVSLRFPTFWFEPTPQGLFMLQVAFGQSKYYSDNLSENVKRGFRQKLRRGEWPTRAPFGYVNNPKTRNIEPDPLKARIIRKTFEEFGKGIYNLKSMSDKLALWGIIGKNGKPICKATLHRMLTNSVYLGLITHNGEAFAGTFEPIVSRAAFEAVQKALKQKAKPRHSKIRHDFPFTGLLTCGECGGMITAQWAKKKYRYYRCSKKLGKCSQRYLSENLLILQLKQRLQTAALCDDWADKMLSKIDLWEKEEAQSAQSSAQNLDVKLKDTEIKLDKLVNGFLDGTIEKETFLSKKDELIKTKTDLKQMKSGFGRKGNNQLEPLRDWVKSANYAGKLVMSHNYPEIKAMAEKIGTNRLLLDRNVRLDLARPYDLLPKYKFLAEHGKPTLIKNSENFFWSG